MKKRLSNQPKLTTEQVKMIAQLAMRIQDLHNEGNLGELARKFGTSKQLIQYHVNKIKAEKEGDK